MFLSGQRVDFSGRFFELHGAIRPAPATAIPILVGGRSDAAFVRAGQLGDGWLALWVSPRRFEEAVERIEDAAAQAGRATVQWRHALQLWVGFDERYAPCGPPEVVAEALVPYLALGCETFNFVPEAESLEAAIEACAEVKAVLSAVCR
jgi:luciferase-like monooxygenase